MVKRARNNNSNSNNDKTLKSRAREVVLPPLVIGRGMSCGYAGIPRYLKKAKDRFDNLGYVSAFFNYNIHREKYGIVKNIDKDIGLVYFPFFWFIIVKLVRMIPWRIYRKINF